MAAAPAEAVSRKLRREMDLFFMIISFEFSKKIVRFYLK
jgi:hypothetical protein